MSGSPTFEKLIASFAEFVEDFTLAGNWTDCTLCVQTDLLPLWTQIAHKTPLAPLGPRKPAGKCIVFDAGKEAINVRRLWAEKYPGDALSFFYDYYPAVCARTFQPGVVAEQIGQGLVMFQTPRTGSHFVQSMISQFPEFGVAAEWIRPPLIEAHAMGLVSISAHLRQCALHQRALHAYWATSIVLPFLEILMERMTPDDRTSTIDFFSRGHLFLTTRRSRTAQTWSQIRATRSGVFHVKSRDKADSTVDPQLLPIEKFWFWNLMNGIKVQDSESLARSMAAKVGKQAAEVPYEEIQSHVFLPVVVPRIFGHLYDPSRHRVDPNRSTYAKQSTAEDTAVVTQLELLLQSSRGIDFRHRTGIENVSYRGVDAGFRWGDAGLDISTGRLNFILWPVQAQSSSTIAIQFTATANAGSHVGIEIHRDNQVLASVKVSNEAAYCLFLDGCVMSTPRTIYSVNVVGQQAQAVVVSIDECFVPFAITPEFPWMRVIQREESFILCEFDG